MSEDKEAILAGLTREESDGPTEGHITRLKLIKRSMYGRAKFDLLRLRVLYRPKKTQDIPDAKPRADRKRRRGRAKKLRAGEHAPNRSGLMEAATSRKASLREMDRVV